jgi:adenine-specific DNA-methyltransferase
VAQLELPDWPQGLDHPYLKTQLIPYIGNKRSLQGRLAQVFRRIAGGTPSPGQPFLDPFAGSGAVSRLARFLGFRVIAGDWEFYAYVLNFAHLCVGRSEGAGLFAASGGMQGVIEDLNRLPAPAESDLYIAQHYAPANTESADYRVERLFYTRENALRIDAIRARIESLYPGFELQGDRKKEKFLLLAALLYQSATHTNTSGVFKACHKGFGGHSRDALSRILAPIRLQAPELVDGPPAEVEQREAADLSRGRPVELCYLDPPYNQHQYGSNYHLLNTIALWDRPPVSGALGADGRLLHKAGIRPDWVKTRSLFCYRHSAAAAFRELLEAVDARWIVVSCNNGGIIPLEALVESLAGQGRLTLEASDYTAYRGGRQSISRQLHTQEMLLVLKRGPSTPVGHLTGVRRSIVLNRLRLLLRGSFHPERIASQFRVTGGGICVSPGGGEWGVPMWRCYRFPPEALAVVEKLALCPEVTEAQLSALAVSLEGCRFADLGEEVDLLAFMLARPGVEPPLSRAESAEVQRRILRLLRKYTHRKYRERFEATLARLRLLDRDGGSDSADLAVLRQGLARIQSLARARFDG